MAKSSVDLEVWKKSIDLTTTVYGLTAGFPREEMYGLTSQMRRAAVSIASNIAEGSARGTTRDFRQFVKIAKGSNAELETQLIVSARLGFGDQRMRERVQELSREIGRMLSGLSTYLTAKIQADRSSSN
jgi:four helix bundle protein